MDRIATALEVLGLGPQATRQDIENAYRTLAKEWHPDVWMHDEKMRRRSEEKFKAISNAFELLDGYEPRPSEQKVDEQAEPSATNASKVDRERIAATTVQRAEAAAHVKNTEAATDKNSEAKSGCLIIILLALGCFFVYGVYEGAYLYPPQGGVPYDPLKLTTYQF